MKKLILICAIALSSCTADESKTECDCTGIFRLDGQTNYNVFYAPVKIDCTTNAIISEIPENYQFWGCK
jgi:hypothetical protein